MQPGIVFDIDDTLYLEADYVRSGFRSVSRFLAQGGAVSFAEAYAYLEGCFERGVRQNTFDLLLEDMPQLGSQFEVRELVEAYRVHAPEIDFLPGMRELLEALRARGARLAALSDGFLESQRRKVAALELKRLVEHAVLTDQWGREFWKPNPRAFEHLAERWEIPAGRLAYVGDNPAKDFVAPNRLRWRTIRLRIPGQLRVDQQPPTEDHAPQVTVCSVDELDRSLQAWI